MRSYGRTLIVSGTAAVALVALAAPSSAAPKNCNGSLHTNLSNVQASKAAGDIPGQVASETAHGDGGLGGVLGWWGPFAASLCKG